MVSVEKPQDLVTSVQIANPPSPVRIRAAPLYLDILTHLARRDHSLVNFLRGNDLRHCDSVSALSTAIPAPHANISPRFAQFRHLVYWRFASKHVLAVGNPEHEHDQPVVVDLIDKAVIADPDSPEVLVSRPLHHAGGSRGLTANVATSPAIRRPTSAGSFRNCRSADGLKNTGYSGMNHSIEGCDGPAHALN